jgi:large subunit ribosomal protein L29
MTKVNVFRELSSEDLLQKEKALKKDLFDLNYHRKMGNVEKPSRFMSIKRDIARIMTTLRERELGDGRGDRKTS